MSLYKQLWIAIALLMSMAFAGSFMLSSMTIKAGIEEQLLVKNIDNANNLAIAAGQVADDPTMVKLVLSAQFDTGHYQYIRYISPTGDMAMDLQQPDMDSKSPAWFIAQVRLDAAPGVAEIQSGWTQLGSIEVKSDPSFAYDTLWSSLKRLLFYFLGAILVFGFLGHVFLNRLTRPLHAVVEQSRAMSQRRFTKVALPKTLEFRELVTAMNQLSDTVREFFETQTSQLQRMQESSRLDAVSGVNSREFFLKNLGNFLNTGTAGSVVLLRIQDLQGLNRSEGRQNVDLLLKHIGQTLNDLLERYTNSTVGRLNGSDFAVLLSEDVAETTASDIHNALLATLKELAFHDAVKIPAANYAFPAGEPLSQILSLADHALAVAETRGASTLEVASRENQKPEEQATGQWRDTLNNIIDKRDVRISYRCTLSRDNKRLHYNIGPEFSDGGTLLTARQLRNWAARLGRGHELDLLTLQTAAGTVEAKQQTLAIKLLSLQSPANLIAQLQSHALQFPKGLNLEIPEFLAIQNPEGFRDFCRQLHPLVANIGLIHAGQHLESIGKIYDCGIAYIVLDSTLTVEIDQSENNQVMVRGLATLFHSIGAKVYGAEITTENQWQVLHELGLDGGSGPYIEVLSRTL